MNAPTETMATLSQSSRERVLNDLKTNAGSKNVTAGLVNTETDNMILDGHLLHDFWAISVSMSMKKVIMDKKYWLEIVVSQHSGGHSIWIKHATASFLGKLSREGESEKITKELTISCTKAATQVVTKGASSRGAKVANVPATLGIRPK